MSIRFKPANEVGYYAPKYECIYKNNRSSNYFYIYSVIPYKVDKTKSARYKVQKLWRSFNVGIDYKLVVNFAPFYDRYKLSSKKEK